MNGPTSKTISQKAYNTRNRTRKWIRFVGLGVSIAGPYLAAFLFKGSLWGAAASGFGLHLLGVAAFILSFFVPKLPRLQRTVCNGHAVCAGCSTLLDALKKEEIFISSMNGRQYCDVCAKRLEAGSLPNEFQDPGFKRSVELWKKIDRQFTAIEGTHTAVPREPAPAQERRQTYSCARCKKQIAEQDCVWVGNHRFCRDCAKASERVFPEAERYKDPKADAAPEKQAIKCSECGRDMPGGYIKGDGYRLCDQCRKTLRYFTVFQYSFNPAPQYEEWERLLVYVLYDCYLLLLEGEGYGACETYARLPFGSFAKPTLSEVAKTLNAIAPDSFGFHIRFRLSADDIRNNEDVRALIDYDRSRCSTLRFSGEGYGDSVALRIQPDNTVMVECVNDGEGNRFASGGYSLPMPQDLADNYDQSRFIEWLQAHFWYGGPIEIKRPAEEEVVKRFLSERRDLYPTSGPANAESPLPSVEGYVLSFHTDAGAQMTFRLVALQYNSVMTVPSKGTVHSRWIYFSYADDAPYLLELSRSSEWVGWLAYPLSEEDVQKIRPGLQKGEKQSNATYRLWAEIASAHMKDAGVVRFLHPDDIDAVKGVLYPCRDLTDENILGGGPLDLPAAEQKTKPEE